ncbi:hypothetical protein BDV25DRAFT_128505 [Aspergillus avenaceus]|uniref:Zn(2)-C6 fungal-type domain-containing protein n=1 Tax=Aspergillus avenaceus TaxID=36643 RepID=A0A5N6TZL2_ASPAV|nr:hypothetical protein BDV25DRAFT_128505 [Aspergillus avenaceus]
MQGQRRRRAVSSCIPCYSKKQKCNRQYPCNHCTRRRRPELCAYVTTPATTRGSSPGSGATSDSSRPPEQNEKSEPEDRVRGHICPDNMAERFGYFDDSESNTLGLLRQYGLDDQSPSSIASSVVQREWQQMPARPILDFLTQYFISEVNWIGQLLHPPRFLAEYERWQNSYEPSEGQFVVSDVEFTVLVLRICAYTSHFLPSPSYMVDTIRGVPLSEVRAKCSEIGDRLALIAVRACSRGSLTRVLHLAFEALAYECEGRMASSWSRLGDSIKAAQSVGLHREAPLSTGMDELERELRRRTMWNLIIWDYRLSRSLDRVPFLDLDFCTTDLPRMRLISDTDDPHTPEPFTERLTQARLVRYWSGLFIGPQPSYDCSAAEERYERFCAEFLPTVPEPFILGHGTDWDDPLLMRQRELLHLALFDYIVQNFRPLLCIDPTTIRELPKYKQALIQQHRRILARAALGMLQCVATLHSLLGQGHTRLSLITFHTFEASVVLVCLLISEASTAEYQGPLIEDGLGPLYSLDPLASLIPDAGSASCMTAVEDALTRLEMLAEGSPLADVGSKRLSQLVSRVKEMRQITLSAKSPPALDFTLPSLPSSLIGEPTF